MPKCAWYAPQYIKQGIYRVIRRKEKKDRKILYFLTGSDKIRSAILSQVLTLGPGSNKPGTRFFGAAFGI